MRSDYYAVLGVAADATGAQITRAYRRLLRGLHPDTRDQTTAAAPTGGPAPAGTGAALELLHEAFRVLGDPDRRAAYDRCARRQAAPRQASPAIPQQPGPPGSYLGGPPDPPLRAGPVRYQRSRPARRQPEGGGRR